MAALFGDRLTDMRGTENALLRAMKIARTREPYRPKSDRWCNQCGRKHNPRDTCDLYLRERETESGEKVKRWAP